MPSQSIGRTPFIKRGSLSDQNTSNGKVEVWAGGEGDRNAALDVVHSEQQYAGFCVVSNGVTDEVLAVRLRELLKLTKKSQRDLSRFTGVPYRSVQTYLSGETRIPATFLLAVCTCLDVEPDFLVKGDFKPRKIDLYDAVYKALSEEGLLGIDVTLEDHSRRVRISGEMTFMIGEYYDQFRKKSLFKGKR